jgi:hypothetical protein
MVFSKIHNPFHLNESLGEEAACNSLTKGIHYSVHIYSRRWKEENRKPVPKTTGRRQKRAYEENNERINDDARKKLMVG